MRGREAIYYGDFFAKVGAGYTPPREEVARYVRAYSDPGTMSAGFGFYRAFQQDAKDNAAFMRAKLAMPVLALSAGKLAPAPYVLEMLRPLGTDVTGGAVEGAGHWLNEEEPDAVARLLVEHFRRADAATR